MEPPIVYEDTDIPPGMSCEDYRRERHPAPTTKRWLPRMMRRLRHPRRRRRQPS
jgi:hypothetical protein